jgi:hypothetical protein
LLLLLFPSRPPEPKPLPAGFRRAFQPAKASLLGAVRRYSVPPMPGELQETRNAGPSTRALIFPVLRPHRRPKPFAQLSSLPDARVRLEDQLAASAKTHPPIGLYYSTAKCLAALGDFLAKPGTFLAIAWHLPDSTWQPACVCRSDRGAALGSEPMGRQILKQGYQVGF